jgi:hypothetical protein
LFVFCNPCILALQPDSAIVGATAMFIRTFSTGAAPRIEGTGTYRGTLIKRADRWLIHRWRCQTDRTPEPMMEAAAHPDAAWEK